MISALFVTSSAVAALSVQPSKREQRSMFTVSNAWNASGTTRPTQARTRVAFGDAAALAARALAVGADETLRARVGAAAREDARLRFSVPVMVSETRRVYERVSGGATP